ncbi:uncharacterized protein LOC107636314 [Arachis ipaensis]|uniref:MULE transposase domain-containing protein n=1 Tax=Arachis hypogaea TaxID=3818 RepID=A0A444ZI62_ARAHY|nr:uncharacterized protein LOC107636314 [Arachis ipaensis]RYR13910.1 hypothetical protein Ahy_B04g070661 [Arachis hypogaea]
MDIPPFMHSLDLDAKNAPEFSEYRNIGVADPEDKEFRFRMEYSSRKISHCGNSDLIQKKACWEIQRYNGRHMYSMGTISQDHSKLGSDTIVEAMKPLVESNLSIKVKSIIVEVQARFNYIISYRKAWLAKRKSIAKVFSGWEESYQALSLWFLAIVQKMPDSQVQIETRPLYNGSQEVDGVRILHQVFWSFNPCIRAFKYCKPLVQVDGTHLYGKYKGCLLVAVAQDGNKNIIPIAFAIVEGETADAWHLFLSNLPTHVVRRDGVGMISDCHESIRAAVIVADMIGNL